MSQVGISIFPSASLGFLLERLELVTRILAAFAVADAHGDLFWRIDDGTLTFYAMCNDVFWWATSDCEPITEGTLPLLEQTLVDLQSLGQPLYLAELYSARARGMRPQRKWLRAEQGALRALFEACGPERDPEEEG